VAFVPALPQVPYSSLGSMGPEGATTLTDAAFTQWLADFRARAAAQGLPDDFLALELAGLRPDPTVVANDSHQAEFSKPISAYLATAVAEGQVSAGRAHRQAAWLDPVALRFGAPAEVLVAIWSMESGYGRVLGDHDVVRAFATLAAQGRRRAWAEGQLVTTLKLIASGSNTREQLTGSWAGAMGQTQFTPEDYVKYAVDADGDGQRDIWGSAPDALGSAANFLKTKAGWRLGEGWQREVIAPSGFDYTLVEAPARPWSDWSAAGLRTADGLPLRPADQAAPAQLLMPMGWRGPAVLVFPNHFSIRAYNNSVSYALAVGLLAQRIGGSPGFLRPWPDDRPTSLDDRRAAQLALARLGYDPGAIDGVLGAGVRRAARQWQASRGLPADGYLSYDLIQRLKAEASSAAIPAPGLSGAAAPL
ncbi:MAG: lytic murein transglycosylase, partial [Caulobacteraceae bacterium]|nr:lytic murein transglycosylase [Caulobacter sp.]